MFLFLVSCECLVLWRMCVNGVVPSSVRSSLFLFTYGVLPRKSGLLKSLRVVSLWQSLHITPLSDDRKARACMAPVRSINNAIYIWLRKQAAHRWVLTSKPHPTV